MLVYSMTHPIVHRAFTTAELDRFTDEELASYYRGEEVVPVARPLPDQLDSQQGPQGADQSPE